MPTWPPAAQNHAPGPPRTGSRPLGRRRPGRVLRASRPPPRSERSPVYDEDTQDRPRRRPFLLAMLVAAALLLALAGSGAVAGNGGTARSSDEGTSVAPPASGQSGSGQGFTHRGRHCHHDQQQQQDPTGAPPV